MKCEEQLNKYEAALKTANLVLFIQPNNQECHLTKLKMLKALQLFGSISDSLLAT